jgi:intracellular multiplication protein IcmL
MAALKPAPKPTMPKNVGGLERVTLRNEFYRDHFRQLVIATPLLAGALLASVGLNMFQFSRPAVNHYFAIDADGRLVPIKSLREPFVTEAKLLNWVVEKATRAYRMDPQNYKAQVSEMSGDFTIEGYAQYVESLKSSGMIDFMTKNLLVSSAIPTGAPLIVERNLTPDGVYYWRVQVPVLVEYRSATKQAQKKRIIEVVVVRRPTVESPQGIGISQFVANDVN